MRLLIAALLVLLSAQVAARNCVLPPVSLPDAQEARQLEEKLRAYEEETRDLGPRPDRPMQRKSLATAVLGADVPCRAPPPGIAGPDACVSEPYEEVEVVENGKVRKMRIVKGEAARLHWPLRTPARSELAKAVEAGDLEQVKRLLAAGARVDQPQKDWVGGIGGWIASATAGWYGDARRAQGDLSRERSLAVKHLAIIEALLAAGAGRDPKADQHAVSAIPFRLSSGEVTPGAFELARRLMELGYAVDLQPGASAGLLDTAARIDDVERLQLMLRHGKPQQASRDSALRTALRHQSWASAVALLEAGADPNAPDNRPSLDMAMNAPRKMLKALIAAKVNPNVAVSGGLTPLALVMHDHELMRDFLELGANPNAVMSEDTSALHYAVYTGWPSDLEANRHLGLRGARHAGAATRLRSVELLLRYGARADANQKPGRSPLFLATPRDHAIIGALMPSAGNVAARDVTMALEGRNETLATAFVRHAPEVARAECALLHLAASAGASSTVAALLGAGASPAVVAGADGRTAHMLAALGGHVEALRVLLDHGRVPIDQATVSNFSRGDEPLARIAKGRRQQAGGTTALMFAAHYGHEAVVRLLLERGADPSRKDGRGHTALDYAREGPRRSSAVPALLQGATRRAP